MTEEKFKKKLHQFNLTEDDKIELCQWYIDNYPVTITTGFKTFFSKINNVKVIKGGNSKYLNYAIKKLKMFFPK